jgi:hypothetical protein
MSSHPDGNHGGSQGSSRFNPAGAQGASRGGVNPDDTADDSERRSSYDPDAAYDRGRYSGGSGNGGGAPFGSYPFDRSQSGRRSGGWRSFLGGDARFLGLPVGLIYAIGAAVLALVFIGAVCGRSTSPGSVAGQVKQLSADRAVTTLPGAQLTLRGGGQAYTTTSTDVDPNAEGEAAYNYRFENVPPGTYALSVAPPAGANLQPEEGITLEVESGELYPQSVMLLPQGLQKPRQLAQSELQPGEAGGYVNDKGERVTYQQGGGFDASDALLMYLLWRNPIGWGYGAPPVIVGSPGSSYRVADPPSQTRSGQTVTQQRPSTPGQGSARPSSGSGATGSAPSRSTGAGNPDAVAPATGSSGAASGSNAGSSTSTQTKPSTSTGTGSSTITQPNTPSQGTSRPSSSTSSPSRSSAPSRSSGGGRR